MERRMWLRQKESRNPVAFLSWGKAVKLTRLPEELHPPSPKRLGAELFRKAGALNELCHLSQYRKQRAWGVAGRRHPPPQLPPHVLKSKHAGKRPGRALAHPRQPPQAQSYTQRPTQQHCPVPNKSLETLLLELGTDPGAPPAGGDPASPQHTPCLFPSWRAPLSVCPPASSTLSVTRP